jgi:hypothetical protein
MVAQTGVVHKKIVELLEELLNDVGGVDHIDQVFR